MSHHELFSDKSSLYSRARPTYPVALYDYLSGLCVKSGSPTKGTEQRTAWDCACGSGQAAIGLAEIFDQVIATDVSRQQIENAKTHPNIEYRVCQSERSGLLSHSMDLICVAQALHWFDFTEFWPEVMRILKPGGIFAAFGYNLPRTSDEVDSLIQREVLDVVDSFWAPQNQLLWDNYSNVDFPFDLLEAPRFTINMDWSLHELFDFIGTFSAVRRFIDEHGDSPIREAYVNAGEWWGDSEQKRTVTLDLVLRVGAKDR